MRTTRKIVNEIAVATTKRDKIGKRIKRLQRELVFAEHWLHRQGWVALHCDPQRCTITDEQAVFPVSDKTVWLDWCGLVVKNRRLTILDCSGQRNRPYATLGYGSTTDFVPGAIIGFFYTEHDANRFILEQERLHRAWIESDDELRK